MKTLDETISDIEKGLFVQESALHYLKEFQGLSKMWNDRLDKEQENQPLTWDELKQMEGKPVWIEYLKDGELYDAEWIVIQDIDDECMGDTQRFAYQKFDYSKTWQAYKKERG